ncbi:MAG: hypothetical protein G01um1014107_217, partial [Parcubacteria group bacterium Gr01-1014_107]
TFSGYAWGGPSVGWVSFNPPFGGVGAMCMLAFDFSLNITPEPPTPLAINVPTGGSASGQATALITNQSNVAGTVAIDNISWPDPANFDVTVTGVGSSCNVAAMNGATCSITLPVMVTHTGASSSPPVTVPVNVTAAAAGGAPSHPDSFNLLISLQPPIPDEPCEPNPKTVLINQRVIWQPVASVPLGTLFFWFNDTEPDAGEQFTCTGPGEGQPGTQCTVTYPTVGRKEAYVEEAVPDPGNPGGPLIPSGDSLNCIPPVNVIVDPLFEPI